MSRIKKPRNKARTPRRAESCGGLIVFGNAYAAAEDAQPMNGECQTDLGIAYHQALDAMAKGASSEQDWCVVVCALNVGLMLCERGIGDEYEQDFIAALDGAFRAKLRAVRTGVWRFDGDAMQAIRHAFAVHDEQIKITTKLEMRDALVEVRRRIDVGNVYREAV